MECRRPVIRSAARPRDLETLRLLLQHLEWHAVVMKKVKEAGFV